MYDERDHPNDLPADGMCSLDLCVPLSAVSAKENVCYVI